MKPAAELNLGEGEGEEGKEEQELKEAKERIGVVAVEADGDGLIPREGARLA